MVNSWAEIHVHSPFSVGGDTLTEGNYRGFVADRANANAAGGRSRNVYCEVGTTRHDITDFEGRYFSLALLGPLSGPNPW